MKIVRILGIDYKINHLDMVTLCGNTDAGNVVHQKCVINIDVPNNSKEHAKSVLLHEILEALNYRLELNLRHEIIVQLEAGLFQVIKDNSKLLKYIGEI